jgi:hypothetical protein
MGDRMKIAIVLTALCLAAFAATLAVRPDLFRPALVRKSDIYGFVPGMPLDDANKLITQRKYRCRQLPDAYVVDCNIDGAKVSITVDGASDRHPVQRIKAELGSGRDPAATVRAISEQYGAQASKAPDGSWVWPVGSRFKLSYDGVAVTLLDEKAAESGR